MSYILNVKPKGNRKLFWPCFVNVSTSLDVATTVIAKTASGIKTRKKLHPKTFRYVNGVRLDNSISSKDFMVNFLECKEIKKWIGKEGKEVIESKTFTWVNRYFSWGAGMDVFLK